MAMYSIRDPVFKGAFRVFVAPFAHVERYLRKRDLWDASYTEPKLAKAISLEKDGCHEVVLWFQPTFSLKRLACQAVLAHEALHATVWTLQRRGVPDPAILDEAGTYYLEWLIREIGRRLPGGVGAG